MVVVDIRLDANNWQASCRLNWEVFYSDDIRRSHPHPESGKSPETGNSGNGLKLKKIPGLWGHIIRGLNTPSRRARLPADRVALSGMGELYITLIPM